MKRSRHVYFTKTILRMAGGQRANWKRSDDEFPSSRRKPRQSFKRAGDGNKQTNCRPDGLAYWQPLSFRAATGGSIAAGAVVPSTGIHRFETLAAARAGEGF